MRRASVSRSTLAALFIVPALTLGTLGLAAGGDPSALLASPWPWVISASVYLLATAAVGRWAGVSDWGFIPFVIASAIAVPWWAASIAAYLFVVSPAGPLAGVVFWFVAIGLLMLLSLIAG